MIRFHFKTNYNFVNQLLYKRWVKAIITSENKTASAINFVFCDDEYLLNLNLAYLNHNTYTDIITFDYCNEKKISGDVFISIDRVLENSKTYNTLFEEELLRVMAHGILHLCGYGDKTKKEAEKMRLKENEKIKLFHVEQKP